MTDPLNTIADELQWWLDWQQQNEQPDNAPLQDGHTVGPPVRPTRGLVQVWIDVLRTRAVSETR